VKAIASVMPRFPQGRTLVGDREMLVPPSKQEH
jgi:hypothetical protein